MGAALGLTLVFLAALVLGARTPRSLQTCGAIAARAVLLLFPPAARNALALTNCAQVTLTAAGCSSLDGCVSGPGSGVRGAAVATRVLVTNPFHVCWTASHMSAGGLAVATLIVVVVGFPLASFWAVWQYARAARLRDPLGSSRGGVKNTSSQDAPALIYNPLHVGVGSKAGPVAVPAVPALPLVLWPFLADYRSDAWYARHADLILALLLAALQVSTPRGAALLMV